MKANLFIGNKEVKKDKYVERIGNLSINRS